MAPDTSGLVASILNSAWLVRHYARGGRSTIHRTQRQDAIKQLGLAVRYAFSASDDFEALLAAVVDGLRPRDEQPF
jgi:hypothetical protein